MTVTKRYWTRWTLALLAIAAIVHLVSVWAAPRLIMRMVLGGVPAPTAANRAYFPPMTTADSRSIVMPSPDLLYATCVYDLADGPLRIKANPALDSYWSIALYSAASDNWFVVNDRQAGGRPVELVVVQAGVAGGANAAEAARVIESPSPKGLVLMRVLAGDYAKDPSKYEAARRTLSCTQPS
jgi:uncharacterized membrane protein